MAIIKKIASQDYVTTEASSIANDVVDVKLESHVVSWDKIVDAPFIEQEDGRIALNEACIPDTIARVKDIPSPLPEVTAENNGAFLRVVDGAWAVATIPSAEGVSF